MNPAQPPKTVVVIDDHDIVRFGLEMLVEGSGSLALAGSAPTLAQGLELIERTRPDLVITDMAVGDSSGLDTVRAVVAAQRPRPTLVVTMQDELLYGEQVLALGARGFVMKENAHAAAIPAAMAVLDGGTWTSPRLNARLLNRKLERNHEAAQAAGLPEAGLTIRELEVLEMLKSGNSTKEVASALGLSARTVDIHRANIKRKLGLRSAAELIAYASARI
ncbi:MAG: response regulator transcription factor [Burkholderiales bacterium]|nr:response regulator transcription factor [Burkholderiales bacterium]